jgi:hypothetical protein
MLKDTVAYLKFKSKTDASKLSKPIASLASRSFEASDGTWVIQFDGKAIWKAEVLLAKDDVFQKIRKSGDVETIFDMPVYLKGTAVMKRLRIPRVLLKSVSAFDAKLDVSIYLTT